MASPSSELEVSKLKRRVSELESQIQRVREETTNQVKNALDEQIETLSRDGARIRERLRTSERDNQYLRGVVQTIPGPAQMVVRPFWPAGPVGIDDLAAVLLMPFNAPWSAQVHATVDRALVSVGLRCSRGDQLTGRAVMADVWRCICESGLVIADLTGGNSNVTYELGLVDGIGRSALLLCQSANPGDLPFDFLGHRLIVYSVDQLEALEKELVKRVRSLRGNGSR